MKVNLNLNFFQSLRNFKFSRQELLFMLKAFIALILWLVLNYFPKIDELIMLSIRSQTLFLMDIFGNADFVATKIYKTEIDARFFLVCKGTLVKVAEGWAGKSLLFLYAAFIFIFPNNNLKRKFLFLLIGLLILHEYNVLRIVALSYVLKFNPAWYNFLHIYFFQTIIYVLLFLLIRKFIKTHENTSEQTDLRP